MIISVVSLKYFQENNRFFFFFELKFGEIDKNYYLCGISMMSNNNN